MNMNDIVGRDDLLLVTLDTLRYDVAQATWRDGATPNLAKRLPATGWERRHTPGTFTYAAHAAFFAGFLPTPARPGKHARPFAVHFPGAETVTADTCILDADNLVEGLAQRGYHTICIGGVGFFNKLSPLGSVFPALFAESHWSPALGVTDPDSTEHQVRLAIDRLAMVPRDRRVFLFMNISALHQPNCCYVEGATRDTLATHRAALAYVDRQLPPLFASLQRRGNGFAIFCSDHGTAYGDDGYHGHRAAHPCIWDVPYAEFRWERMP
jgi:hypothetical protein